VTAVAPAGTITGADDHTPVPGVENPVLRRSRFLHPQPRPRGARLDAFPHTRRPLPWCLAAFLAMLFLIPIDSTELKVHLPVGSQIDRFAIVGLVFAWFCFGGDQRAFMRTRRSKLYVGAACVFLALAVASLLLDAGRIVNIGDFNLAEKRFGLLGSFLILSWFTLTALRYEDVRGFASYLIGLGTVMAIGMLVERHTGYNVFYNWSATIFKPIATVAPSPTVIHPVFGSDGRVTVVGPTLHGLAATTMFVVVMPFALVRVFDATSRKTWWLNALAFGLMLVAAAATDRKTALIVPVAVVIYLACYRPRQVMRLAPIGAVVLLGVVHLASPGALGTIFTPSAGLSSSSTEHRIWDFTDVTPDVLAHPVIGRGFGTLAPEQSNQFRINDDEYIDEIWEVGAVGLFAYLCMILAPVVSARRTIRGRDPDAASLALAASAGCIAYLVVNALFDAMSFPQAPYMFFMVAALTTIAAGGPAGNVEPTRKLVRVLARRQRSPRPREIAVEASPA
jgi:hypothetical protein